MAVLHQLGGDGGGALVGNGVDDWDLSGFVFGREIEREGGFDVLHGACGVDMPCPVVNQRGCPSPTGW